MDPFLRIIFFVVVFIFAPLIVAIQFRISESLNGYRANGWQPTQATIHQVIVRQDNQYWHADLSYSYSWEGEFYSGHRRRSFAREKVVDGFVATFPRGASLMVRVNPDKPENSILLFNEQFVRT